jgi:tellurite resistance protein
MARSAKVRNIHGPAVLGAEIESLIADAADSSLSASQAATALLARVDGAAAHQLLAAAVGAMREQQRLHEEDVAEAVEDSASEASDLEDEVDDLKIEIGELRAKLADPKGSAP